MLLIKCPCVPYLLLKSTTFSLTLFVCSVVFVLRTDCLSFHWLFEFSLSKNIVWYIWPVLCLSSCVIIHCSCLGISVPHRSSVHVFCFSPKPCVRMMYVVQATVDTLGIFFLCFQDFARMLMCIQCRGTIVSVGSLEGRYLHPY